MKTVPCLIAVLCGAPGLAAADLRRVPTGKLDVWDGPFASLADATAHDLSPATELPPFDDDQTLPTDLPIDELVAQRREVVACTNDERGGCVGGEHMQYRLAAQTTAGWFTSGQLGLSQNRNRCYFTSVSGGPSRFVIQYKCDVGRFNWASKEFQLLCGVDATGRPACGRTLLGAQRNVHRGGKSESATDVIYDTMSCAGQVRADTVLVVPRKVERDADDTTPHIHKLAKCAGATHFPLGGPYPPGAHAPPPLFDDAGAWVRATGR